LMVRHVNAVDSKKKPGRFNPVVGDNEENNHDYGGDKIQINTLGITHEKNPNYQRQQQE